MAKQARKKEREQPKDHKFWNTQVNYSLYIYISY